ncbi:MAG: hypothetical protein K9M96_09625 [Deltaproteobacteria bacterium]|nr:hypothetical protein [Deltaproteobacteria bacterium]
MKSVLKGLIFFFFMGVASTAAVADENTLPSFHEGIDRLAAGLTQAVAARYFDADKRPRIKVAVFDFTDSRQDITVGSRYISDRLKLAFATGPQFELLDVSGLEEGGTLITAETFGDNHVLRERITGELKAHVYVFGHIRVPDPSRVTCTVALWGTKPPFENYRSLVRLDPEALAPGIGTPRDWALHLTPSGVTFFKHIRIAGMEEGGREAQREDLAEVIFLTQPMCDDLNLSWQVRADGMIYDMRKKRDAGALRNRTGEIMQSRVKARAALKELSYIIKNFSLVIRESGGEAYRLEPYVVPKGSPYYFIPYLQGEIGLRFVYLWNQTGKSKKPSSRETGKGWSLFMAEADWPNIMPVGIHTATATLEPVAETDYGTKRPRSEYVSRFKFRVKPGRNIYVVNYVYRRDRPEIFVRRLDIQGSRDKPIRAVKRITEVYEVYGAGPEDQGSEDRRQISEDRRQ